MRENMGEQLTVDDMARAALFSKFHFTRIFQRVTGVSPGRFLSALRLQQAKHLLVTTSLKVADISLMVGYNSVGTFSARFSRSVGMPPTTYRRRAGFAPQILSEEDGATTSSGAQVSGHIREHSGSEARLVFVGLFVDRIPEGKPVRCTVLNGSGRFKFEQVPPGTWYLLAQSLPADGEADDAPDGHGICVASHGPIVVGNETVVEVEVEPRPVRALDPPVLLALQDTRKLALERMAEDEARDDRAPNLATVASGTSPSGVPTFAVGRRQMMRMGTASRPAA
ncbi:helix-turn-helix domain-containing protein [Micromonospora sp. ZYX-F-536]|uniref:helix-turn-helix domain-containing protein n=1 Tax=Micromonospora sp. ZYX-F-536 TaxID=3457629 RepID=UPI00404090D8